jgi:hypothetical protein
MKYKGSRIQPVGPLDFVELLKRLPHGSRMPTYQKVSLGELRVQGFKGVEEK